MQILTPIAGEQHFISGDRATTREAAEELEINLNGHRAPSCDCVYISPRPTHRSTQADQEASVEAKSSEASLQEGCV